MPNFFSLQPPNPSGNRIIDAFLREVFNKLNLIRGIIFNSKTVRITVANSPYSVTDSDMTIFCDTDGGAITVLLPDGDEGRKLTLKNVGTNDNDVTLTTSGAETIELTTIYDGETIDTIWNAVEYWK